MVAILENYQTNRGTVEVPSALTKYMNDRKEIELVTPRTNHVRVLEFTYP